MIDHGNNVNDLTIYLNYFQQDNHFLRKADKYSNPTSRELCEIKIRGQICVRLTQLIALIALFQGSIQI